MALRRMTIAEIDAEVGELFEEAYLKWPDEDCIDNLADLYEIPQSKVRSVLQRRNVDARVQAQQASINRKNAEQLRRNNTIGGYLKYAGIGFIVLSALAITYCSNRPIPDDRTQIEKGADTLCETAGGCY